MLCLTILLRKDTAIANERITMHENWAEAVSSDGSKKYEIVWLVHEPSKYKEYQFENVKFVQNFKKGSTIRRAEAYKYALTSKYIFYTQAFNWIGMSRRNQLFIDLWHGCGYKANKNGRKVFFD